MVTLTKSMAYDNPSYITRNSTNFPQNTAGASSTFSKFLAFTQTQLFSIVATTITAGTSAVTAWNGTATVTAAASDAITGYHVSGTTTTTLGPFALNAGVGGFNQIQLSTNTLGSAAAPGGRVMQAGDYFYLQRGTDATAVILPGLEYAIQPLANISN